MTRWRGVKMQGFVNTGCAVRTPCAADQGKLPAGGRTLVCPSALCLPARALALYCPAAGCRLPAGCPHPSPGGSLRWLLCLPCGLSCPWPLLIDKQPEKGPRTSEVKMGFALYARGAKQPEAGTPARYGVKACGARYQVHLSPVRHPELLTGASTDVPLLRPQDDEVETAQLLHGIPPADLRATFASAWRLIGGDKGCSRDCRSAVVPLLSGAGWWLAGSSSVHTVRADSEVQTVEVDRARFPPPRAGT